MPPVSRTKPAHEYPSGESGAVTPRATWRVSRSPCWRRCWSPVLISSGFLTARLVSPPPPYSSAARSVPVETTDAAFGRRADSSRLGTRRRNLHDLPGFPLGARAASSGSSLSRAPTVIRHAPARAGLGSSAVATSLTVVSVWSAPGPNFMKAAPVVAELSRRPDRFASDSRPHGSALRRRHVDDLLRAARRG